MNPDVRFYVYVLTVMYDSKLTLHCNWCHSSKQDASIFWACSKDGQLTG